MKVLAIKYQYRGRYSAEIKTGTYVLTVRDATPTHKVIETFQKKMQDCYCLDRIPSVSYQVCDGVIPAMIATSKL